MDWDKVEWSKFSPQEAHRMRHRMIEELHKGHDLMHAEMLLILFSSIMVAQVLLFVWRQKRPRFNIKQTGTNTVLKSLDIGPTRLSPYWGCG